VNDRQGLAAAGSRYWRPCRRVRTRRDEPRIENRLELERLYPLDV